MSNALYDILKGKFLTNEHAFKTWAFIIYCVTLAIIMIYTSHEYESKVYQDIQLKQQVEQLNSEYADLERQLMFMQMESTVAKKLADSGIKPAQNPPRKIIIKPQVDE